jgi:hypothetical protein
MLTYADVFIVYLLECLQKTSPPAIIFCENKADVDDIHEYLLLKGVNAGTKVLAYWYKSAFFVDDIHEYLLLKGVSAGTKVLAHWYKSTHVLVQKSTNTDDEASSEHAHTYSLTGTKVLAYSYRSTNTTQ